MSLFQYWRFLPVLLLWASCNSGTPQPAIPDEKMARIMADLFVAEAATNGLGGYEKDSLQQFYFHQVFEMHGLTAEQYETELRNYAEDLPRLEALVNQAEKLVTPFDTTQLDR